MKSLWMILLLVAFAFSPTPAAAKKTAPDVLTVVSDTVHRLEPSGDDVLVIFKKHAAKYHLKKTSPEFNAVMVVLSQSNASLTKVRLKVDANTLEIKGLAK